MGIPGLLPLLAPIARPVSLERYRGLTAAVDAMAWLHRGIYAGDVRTLAHAQHAAWYREEEVVVAARGRRGDGDDDYGGGDDCEDYDGRYQQRRRQWQDDDDDGSGDDNDAAAAAAEEEEAGPGPSRRIDFDRAAEPAAAAAARPDPARRPNSQRASSPMMTTTPAQAAAATDSVLSYVLRQCSALLTTYGLSSVLLVIDGDSLPSKTTTNSHRSDDRRRCYRRAREAEGRGESARVVRKLYAQSCGITYEMRRGLVERVRREQQMRQRMQQMRGGGNGDGGGNPPCSGGTLDCLVAPYEADAQLAQLAHAGLVDVVLAEDSDLLAYGCPRVVFKVDVNGGRGQEIQLLRDLASMGSGSGGASAGSGSGVGIGGGGRNGATASATAGRGHRSSSSSQQPSFQNWTHDMFVYMCILSGCDYCAGVPGVGIRTAHKLVRMYRTPSRIFRALRAAGRMPRPVEVEVRQAVVARRRDVRDGTAARTSSTATTTISFEERFWTAYRTFRHQTVYNPATGRAEPLLPIVEVASTAAPDWDAVGPMMDDEMARGIATGRIHPARRIPWEAVLAAASSSRAAAARTRPGRVGEDLLLATATCTDSADRPIAPRSRHQFSSGTANRNSPNSAGRARRALANSKDLFRFFARKPKGSGSSGTGDDSSHASPSSRSGRNRPPLREIFVDSNGSDADHNRLKNGNVQRPVAASVTNQREKSARAGGGGHQAIPIHFGDYSTALVGTAFQPLSRQNNRADTSATGGLASRNISRAVQCLKANAAKARVIKYRGRRSPRGSKGNAMERRAGSERHEDGDMTSFCPVPEASSQSVQSAPEDLLVRVHQNGNESVRDQVYGRSSLDANRDYDCNHFLGGEDASQYHSRAALDRGFVDGTAFEYDEILPHSETDQCYDTYSKQKVCGEYDQPFLEYDWSEGVEYQDRVDCGVAHREGTARVEQEELPAAPKYQYHSTDKEALDYDERGEEHEKFQLEAFGDDLQVGNGGRRESPIDAPIGSNYQQPEQDRYDHFHDKELLPSNNLQVDVDGEYWQHLRGSEGVKVPGSENIDDGHGASEYPPLDLRISSPQLKRQNLNATPDFRNSGDCAIQNQYDQDGKFDHQFPLENDSGGGVDDEGLQGICAEQFYDGIIDYGSDFPEEGNYCFD